MENQLVEDNYDPTYKVKEMKEYLEDQYNRLYIPGQQLSLDKTLIWAFGRLIFKVRNVTSKAWDQTLRDHRCGYSICPQSRNLHRQVNVLRNFV
jgi:hypothetical protein